jgi:membrane protein implicated in regulation of membrane protease activity
VAGGWQCRVGGGASVLLLALSGWFLTAAALAGGAGIVAAQAFNYMLPSAAIRLLAIVRTGARYGERLASHGAAFGALARLRPALYRAITAAPPRVALALGRGEATARLIGDVDAVEWRFVRLSRPWGAVAAIMAGAALTLLGGWQAMVATLACAGGVLALALQGARRLEQPGRAVQRATGALREVAMLGSAAAELRCFALEDWAAARVGGERSPGRSAEPAGCGRRAVRGAARDRRGRGGGFGPDAVARRRCAGCGARGAGGGDDRRRARADPAGVDRRGGCARRRRGWMPSSMRRRTHVPLSDRAARRSSSSMATGSYRAAGSR